jgi:hypothetical protein
MSDNTRREIAKGSLAALAAAAVGTRAWADDDDTYTEPEIVSAVAGFFGTTAAAAGAAVARVFRDNGRPNGYIKGEEGAGAIGVGLRYGKGQLFTKRHGAGAIVYWQGPSVGFDAGGNASKVFTLVYGLRRVGDIYQRFPGVEGSYYFVAGLGVNYQRADHITLAPMRAGVGLRAGANIGYLDYSRKRHVLPF